MPDDLSGNYSLPPGYKATTGNKVLVTQHNPIFEDVATAMTARLTRNGTAPMLADLPMGGNKITNVANGLVASDAATVGQASGHAGTLKATPADADEFGYSNSAAGWGLVKLTFANLKSRITAIVGVNGPAPGLPANVNDATLGSFLGLAYTETSAVAANLPALGGAGATSRFWNVVTFGLDSRTVQYATEVFGIGTVRGRTFVRVKHDATWYPWVEAPNLDASGNLSVAGKMTVGVEPAAAKDVATKGYVDGLTARAWVCFKGTSPVSIYGSNNVSSVTYVKTGTYTVNFTTALVDTNYACVASYTSTDNGSDSSIFELNTPARTTSSVTLQSANDAQTSYPRMDRDRVSVIIM